MVDFAVVEGDGRVTRAIADRALTRLGVDDLGLDGADRRYLSAARRELRRRPGRGGDDLRGAIARRATRIEEVIEPFLLQQGLIQRTPRGRMLAAQAWTHLGLAPPRPAGLVGDLFERD